MAGNWNTKPRRGDKSVATQRSDQEHAIRQEYRRAGEIDGLVSAWAIAASMAKPSGGCSTPEESYGAWQVAAEIAAEILDRSPKSGRVELDRYNADPDMMSSAEEIVAARRRSLRAAQAAATKLARVTVCSSDTEVRCGKCPGCRGA